MTIDPLGGLLVLCVSIALVLAVVLVLVASVGGILMTVACCFLSPLSCSL